MQELNTNEMEKVTGGANKQVNTGVKGLNAALRSEPRKSSRQVASIPNGEYVDIIDGVLYYDAAAGRHFVLVSWKGQVGYIASSIVGLRR